MHPPFLPGTLIAEAAPSHVGPTPGRHLLGVVLPSQLEEINLVSW